MSPPALDTVVATLRESQDYVRENFKTRIDGVFGSYARNEATAASDVDIVFSPDEDMSLFDLVGLGDYLESKLGCHVDLVSKRVLKQESASSILDELVPV